MKIKTKKEMHELYIAGEFGNRLKTWMFNDFIKIIPNNDVEYFTMGYRGLPGVKLPSYGLPLLRFEVIEKALEWNDIGFVFDNIVVWGCKPPESIIICQGEIRQTDTYYDLLWTDIDLTMRPALHKRQYYAQGLKAKIIIEHFMDYKSIENIKKLFEKYPDSVIEFSVFNMSVGELGWNTVFWEVRDY